jgi:hypothetical protein
MVESEVSIVATKYLEMWNEQYASVNETEIVSYTVSAAMSDIESWIEGQDPNGARETAGCEAFTREDLLELYQCLAASASFFHYSPRLEYLAL